MTDIVADASVGVPWIVAEELSPIADRIITGEYRIHVPAHWHAEIANGLWNKQRRGLLTMEEVLGILAEPPGVIVHELPALLIQAARIAIEHDRTV